MGAKRWIGVVAVLGLVMAIGGQAAAAEAPPADRRVDWLKRPSRQDFFAVYPKGAWKRGDDGKATIGCEVSVQGVLFKTARS